MIYEDYFEDLVNDFSMIGIVYYFKEVIFINLVKYLDFVFLVYNEMCFLFEIN